MKKEEKIFLKPEDDIDEVVDKIKDSKASKVILNIPEGSVLKSSLDNFHTLKRESLQEDKDLLIESVDPHIEELADLSKIDSLNPVFGKKERMVSDIIPRSKLEGGSSNKKQQIKNNEFFSGDFKKKRKKKTKSWFSKIFKTSKTSKKPKKKKSKSKNKKDWINLRWIVKKWLPISIALLILGGLYFVGFYILPQAEITINLNETEVPVDQSVRISTDISTTTFDDTGDFDLSVPGEIIISSKNTQMKFEASEERDVERKAKGEVTIYNEYGDESITLVENTRLETPDGRIFLTDQSVTVPPAVVEGDDITPSTVEVSVTASEAGQDYNINPSSDEEWSIPGFREAGLTAMYEGFYAIPDGEMTGGFIGYTQDPTEDDIENATQSVRDTLRSMLENEVLITGASDFRILDEASEFQVIDENVNREVDESGNFSVFGQAQIRNFAFKGEEFKKSLFDASSDIDYPVIFTEEDFNYDNIEIDWDNGVMTFDVEGFIYVKPKIDTDSFTSEILGKGKQDIRSTLDTLPNLKSAKVSLWPFWVKTVPNSENKVNITIK